MSQDQVRRFFVPILYGMATANFVAVIQLISAPQFQLTWNASESSYSGSIGMMLMIVSIPFLVAFAAYSDLDIREKIPASEDYFFKAGSLVGIGLTGLTATLYSFRPAFGIVFGASILISAVVVLLTPKTDKTRKPHSN
jgi:hypothetical protein